MKYYHFDLFYPPQHSLPHESLPKYRSRMDNTTTRIDTNKLHTSTTVCEIDQAHVIAPEMQQVNHAVLIEKSTKRGLKRDKNSFLHAWNTDVCGHRRICPFKIQINEGYEGAEGQIRYDIGPSRILMTRMW